MSESGKAGPGDWASRVELSGDFRFRGEEIAQQRVASAGDVGDASTEYRARIRARAALEARVTDDSTVVLQKPGADDIVSTQLVDRRETVNDGTPLVFARATALGAGGTLTFDVTGLPHHPRWPRYLALTLAIGFVLVGLREGFRHS